MSQATPWSDQLDMRLLERETSLFGEDVAANHEQISALLKGRRVLIVGGGGSIGGATTRQILRYAPSALHIIDHSENYLAELVRDIRSSVDLAPSIDLEMWPIDFGGAVAERLIAEEAPYDYVLNFAALKHVRSEKNIYSLLQMLDTNVVRQARFKQWIVDRGGAARYFAVSTDKAANPTSLMGATKRLMEDVLFDIAPSDTLTVTSARFANVLFSNGSLPQSWMQRLEAGQPLAVPRDTRRFFVTRGESGQICLLAALLGAHSEILIPRLDPEQELRLLEKLAREFLSMNGYEAVLVADEKEAREKAQTLRAQNRWPVLLTPLDTSGEKPYEEFVGAGESAREIGMSGLMAVAHRPAKADSDFIAALSALTNSAQGRVTKADVVGLLQSVVPNMQHKETDKNLDQRM
jgi:FlaA1/EpsC-like NDP-sugar epimerase